MTTDCVPHIVTDSAAWSALNLDIPGRYDRGTVTATFSNRYELGFYRTGVKLP